MKKSKIYIEVMNPQSRGYSGKDYFVLEVPILFQLNRLVAGEYYKWLGSSDFIISEEEENLRDSLYSNIHIDLNASSAEILKQTGLRKEYLLLPVKIISSEESGHDEDIGYAYFTQDEIEKFRGVKIKDEKTKSLKDILTDFLLPSLLFKDVVFESLNNKQYNAFKNLLIIIFLILSVFGKYYSIFGRLLVAYFMINAYFLYLSLPFGKSAFSRFFRKYPVSKDVYKRVGIDFRGLPRHNINE